MKSAQFQFVCCVLIILIIMICCNRGNLSDRIKELNADLTRLQYKLAVTQDQVKYCLNEIEKLKSDIPIVKLPSMSGFIDEIQKEHVEKYYQEEVER